MKNLKVGIGQIPVIPGNVKANADIILKAIKNAHKQNLSILAFPELCLSGYLIGDMWERPSFLRECSYWQQKIISASGNTLVIFGSVIIEWDKKGEDGRPRKFNGAIAALKGKQLLNPGINQPYFVKTLLPNYREFDESRHFFDLRKLAMEQGRPLKELLEPLKVEINKQTIKLGITMCEDGWSEDYLTCRPFSILREKECELIFNLSCSPFTLGKKQKRNRVFAGQAKELRIPLVYVNSVGVQNIGKTVFTFDGSSIVYSKKGEIIFEAEPYKTGVIPVNIPINVKAIRPIKRKYHFKSKKNITKTERYRDIYQSLLFGVRNLLSQLSLKRVVIGVSGGIDSAVNAAFYGSFLTPKNLLLVSMPSKYNSPKTRNLAVQLARNLGCYFMEISISKSIQFTRNQIHSHQISPVNGGFSEKLVLSGLDMENVQARDRSSRILAAIASGFNGVFTCNANKAEITVGYSTLYGDLSGYLAATGDLWKEDIYGLGRFLNRHIFKKTVIPAGCFNIVPSAELSSSQNIEHGDGDPLHYPYHDKLFFSWVQSWLRNTPEEILEWYMEGRLTEKLGCPEVKLNTLFPTVEDFIGDLERWWKMYNFLGVAKRIQAPPVMAISSRAFGFDHREHLGEAFFSTRYTALKKKTLKDYPR